MSRVYVVGIGADGWASLSADTRELLSDADLVIGGTRHLDLLPEVRAERVTLPSPLLPALREVLGSRGDRLVCVLASGDPMFYGIGRTIVDLLGPDDVIIVPNISSLALACAQLRWPVEDVEVISAVARRPERLRAALHPGRRLLVLSEGARTPAIVAQLLTTAGYGDSEISILNDLGAERQGGDVGRARTWKDVGQVSALNVVAVQCVPDRDTVPLGRSPGLPDEVYDSDGQLTKREVRAVTLAHLRPGPGELLWDVGAGSGSIGIEWMRHHPTARAIAVESAENRVKRIVANAMSLGVPGIQVIEGRAPEALDGLDRPHAVFIGGGLTGCGVVEACWAALRPGGRLVATAVTVESETALASWHAELGGDLVRLAVSRAEPLGSFTTWRPMLPVTQWTVRKESTE
ncbi:precorrin-6Y C5,15-methyltransferase (decarboxylating) [Herbihabitans rhizosphaerae]|uniref:Precorrin-6Y C5,15-methyltransferase (Decarboxylating) n=1 Tax=Herbihabitans rhizosphaerae TaxID=1872711 RepID=A0A4V2EU56_9PSEU|nr:precorrin-6y C5,15-methyltransferase (decarboxylating) subunit CbiE [Herbihabitans rhizosphaerae]RZS43403.1 precorrin-6Y C5,15-methyltransferase (decarboxylating) [Herbihabitans rhizosphaerae]